MNFKAILITACIWFPALITAEDIESEPFQACNPLACVEGAKLLNESLNSSVDPCTDFYAHVCNGWESRNQGPSLSGSYDVYQDIDNNITEKLSYILGNRTLVESNQTIIDKVTIMYKACIALPDAREAFIRVLNESGFPLWPILTEGNIFSSTNSADLLRNMSISTIAHVDVVDMKAYATNPQNPYSMVEQLSPAVYCK
nr:phosphate-regulating neutral endopeptidase PHEX-like [Dermacentor andersoni]